MAGFGGAVKLTGESEYRRALQKITQNLREVTAQMKLASASYDKTDASTKELSAMLTKLSSNLQTQKDKVKGLKQEYDALNKEYQEGASKHKALLQRYEEEKNKLAQVEKQYGKNSEEYKKQKQVVDALAQEVKKSTSAQDANEKSMSKMRTQIANAETTIVKTEKAIAELNGEMQKSNSAAKAASTAYGSLKNTIAAQEDLLDKLKRQYAAVVLEQGKGSSAARELAGRIKSLSGELNENKTKLSNADKAAEDLSSSLDKAGRSAKGASGGFTIMRGALANLAAAGIQKVTSAIQDQVGTAIARVDTLNAYMTTMTNLGYKAEDVAKAQEKLKEGILGLPTTLPNIVSMQQQFAALSGKLQESTDLTLALNNATLAGGQGQEVANGALEQWYQIIAAGKPDLMAWRIINTAMPAQMNQIAQAVMGAGKKSMDLFKAWQKGEVTTKQVTDALIRLNQKGGGGLASFEKQAHGASGGIQTSFQNVKTAIANAMANVIESIGSKKIAKVLDDLKVKINEAGKVIGKAVNFIIDNRAAFVGALKAIIAAFAYTQVMQFTKAITSSYLSLKELAGGIGLLTGLTKGMTAAQTASTLATNAGTIATNLFNAAWRANPIGMVITGLGLLAAGVAATIKVTSDFTKVTNANGVATDKLAKEHEKLAKTLDDNAKARKDTLRTANDEIASADYLMDKLEKLSKVENKSTSQKQEMKRIVSQLNSIMPELNLQYDAEKDKLNKSTDAIKANIKAQKELNLAKAQQKNLKSIAEDIVKTEEKQAKAVKQNEKNQKEFLAARKAREDFERQYTPQQISMNGNLLASLTKLSREEEKAGKNYSKSQKIVDDYSKELDKLNKSYEKTAGSASNYFKKADITTALGELTDKVRKAGREIPQALTEGMEAGRYAVPKSVNELDKLINFDNALTNAGKAGVQIPTSISEGVMSGKMSVQQAMQQVDKIMEMSSKAEKMYQDGAAIPQNLAKGISDGTYTVKEANTLMEQSIKFDELKQKATDAGAAIPQNLADQVRNGSITVQDANKQLKDSIKYEDLVQKATDAGLKIPSTLAEQITAGEVTPRDAVMRMQSLINYKKSFDDAKLGGKAIPNSLRDGILSGEMTVAQANTAMNNWIKFKKALNEAGIDGVAIPKELSAKLVSGKTSVDSAVTQMNRWIKFQAALDAAGKEGAEVPSTLAKRILSGKTKPEEAVKQLNTLMKNQAMKMKGSGTTGANDFMSGLNGGLTNPAKKGQINNSVSSLGSGMKSSLQRSIDAHSPSRAASIIGGYFLDGVYNGVANRSKRSSIFSSIASFGNSLLSRLRASLKEKSPSKATEEMGRYLLEGLSNGIKAEEGALMQQVSTFGNDLTDTMQAGLSNNLALDGISAQLRSASSSGGRSSGSSGVDSNMVDAFKEALSQMKIELDDEVAGEFVDKTVTKLIYN